jgi:hypothetical protein
MIFTAPSTAARPRAAVLDLGGVSGREGLKGLHAASRGRLAPGRFRCVTKTNGRIREPGGPSRPTAPSGPPMQADLIDAEPASAQMTNR